MAPWSFRLRRSCNVIQFFITVFRWCLAWFATLFLLLPKIGGDQWPPWLRFRRPCNVMRFFITVFTRCPPWLVTFFANFSATTGFNFPSTTVILWLAALKFNLKFINDQVVSTQYFFLYANIFCNFISVLLEKLRYFQPPQPTFFSDIWYFSSTIDCYQFG